MIHNIICINCNKIEKNISINNINIVAYSNSIYYYICNNCNGIEHFVRNFEYSKDKDKFIKYMSIKDYEILGQLENANSITESIIIKTERYQLKKYDLYKITNCTHCKIGMKTVFSFFTNYDRSSMYFCNDCLKNKKDILQSKNKTLRDFFLKSEDIKNLKHFGGKYYVGDLIKKRDGKYILDVINKKMEMLEKRNILKKEKKKNKMNIIELRKKDIIKEAKLFNIDIRYDDFKNYIIKDYLYKGDKSVYKLNNIIEMLIEDNFLETKTNFFAYFFALNYRYYRFSEHILNNIYIAFSSKYIDKKSNIYKSIICTENQYIKPGDFFSFYFSYIIKTFCKTVQRYIYYNIYNNYSNKSKNNIKNNFALVKIIAEFYAVKEFKELYKDDKYVLPTRFANLSDAIINNCQINYNCQINKLPDDIYDKYYNLILKHKPTFEQDITKILNKYKEKEPIEINLIKKNKDKVQKYYDEMFVYF